MTRHDGLTQENTGKVVYHSAMTFSGDLTETEGLPRMKNKGNLYGFRQVCQNP